MEPAVPNDEAAGPGAPGHPDHQHQPPQLRLLADDEHRNRGHSGDEAAFRVNANNTIWSYELQPTDGGTRVVETRHAENGVKPISNMSINALFGGVPSFERELVDGMNETLSRIKAAAES